LPLIRQGLAAILYKSFLKGENYMETLLEILQDLHPEVDFETCDTLVDDKIIDSFDIVSIISEINEEFDVVIPAEEIIPENFNSAEALYDLIQRLGDE
jgi:acyl carrier protein